MRSIIVRCAGIVKKGKEYLLVKSDYGGKEYWIFPGGGLEPGETMGECVKREVKEETGIDVSVGKLILINENVSKEKTMIHFTFLCNPLNDDLIIGNDPDQDYKVIKDVKFFKEEEMLGLQNFIPPEMKPLLSDLIRNGFNSGPVLF